MRYTTSDVSHLLNLSPRYIRSFVHAGFIKPERGARGELFHFPRSDPSAGRCRVARSTLTEARIVADGRRVVVDDGSSTWNPESGQRLLDFDIAELAAKAEPTAKKRFQPEADYDAGEWYDIAVELEAVAPTEARQAYQRALALEPRHAAAHINLGRLLHEDGRATEAATHYLQACGISRRMPPPRSIWVWP